MTEFLPGNGSFHACLSPCSTITTPEDADQYLDAYAQYLADKNSSRIEEAKILARKNIGYYAGYQTEEVFHRMLRLFKTIHPVFKRKYPSTAREAMLLGMIYAAKNIKHELV